MKREDDFKFDGIGFNGPHLAKMPFDKFLAEVKHHWPEDEATAKAKELYAELQKKWPAAAAPPVAPATK